MEMVPAERRSANGAGAADKIPHPEKKEAYGASEILERVLSEEFMLYAKARNNHWNTAGTRFHELSRYFEEQYREIEAIAAGLVQRIKALAGPAPASLGDFLRASRAAEAQARQRLADLLGDHEATIKGIRQQIQVCLERLHDPANAVFLSVLLEQHEKMAASLRRVLTE